MVWRILQQSKTRQQAYPYQIHKCASGSGGSCLVAAQWSAGAVFVGAAHTEVTPGRRPTQLRTSGAASCSHRSRLRPLLPPAFASLLLPSPDVLQWPACCVHWDLIHCLQHIQPLRHLAKQGVLLIQAAQVRPKRDVELNRKTAHKQTGCGAPATKTERVSNLCVGAGGGGCAGCRAAAERALTAADSMWDDTEALLLLLLLVLCCAGITPVRR
jgi:hypothetical protein